MSDRSIVITGIGMVSPIGIGADSAWQSLAAYKSGVKRVELLSYIASPDSVGGEVTGFTEATAKKDYLKSQRKSIKVMCREIQIGVASALQAVEHAGLSEQNPVAPERIGVNFGANLMSSPPEVLMDAAARCVAEGDSTHSFQYSQWGAQGMGGMEPLWLLRYLPNMPGCHIGIAVDARGPNNSITHDEASAALSIGEACGIIRRDRADIMIAGTTGTRIHALKTMHATFFDQLADAPAAPEQRCRPFDLNRRGEVVGEGSASLILETESTAIQRGATIYGKILGTGSSCVAERDGTPNRRKALVNAISIALKAAQVAPESIGHINAHGCGSITTDETEAQAIIDVFGQYGRTVPVTALKSYLGNAGSGCGMMEIAGSLLALRHGVIPATLNYSNPDPNCPLNVVHGEHQPTDNKLMLKINVTRVGQASAVVIDAA